MCLQELGCCDRPPSASCDSVSFAQSSLLIHRSRAMWPTLLSLLSLGAYEKPSLSAWPSPVVPLGQSVTLRCHSDSPLKRFTLFKRDGTSLPKLQGHHVNTFTLGPMTREHARSYMCSGVKRSLSVWSDVTDPLQIVVTGRRGPASPGLPGLQAILP